MRRHLQVLVAEDDPINSKIIKKRLEKSGHEVYHTINGEECATAYAEKSYFFDVVLMDMQVSQSVVTFHFHSGTNLDQMPIVDGLTSTKMIRSHEKLHPEGHLSSRAVGNGRVPIFAVSASLVEREKQSYVNAGFDGWILKPIDFTRLNVLLSGIVEDDTRNACLYKTGEWERGGWFERRQPPVSRADTVPSGKSPVQNPVPTGTEMQQPDMDALESSESGSITPVNDNRK